MADSSKLTTKRARPKLGQSPQARWQRRQQEKGNCRACGEPRPPDLRQLCRECQNSVNAYMKSYRAKKRLFTSGITKEQIALQQQVNAIHNARVDATYGTTKKEKPSVDPRDSEAGPSNVA